MTMIKFVQLGHIGKPLLCAVFFACLSFSGIQAQYIPQYSAFGDGLNVGFKAGIQGIALEVNYPFLEKFNIRGAINTFPIGAVTYNGRSLTIDRTNIIGQIDYQPLYGKDTKFARWWFVSVGGSIYSKNTVSRDFKDHPVYGNSNHFLVDYRRASVYIGTGLSNMVISENLFLKLDLGYFIPVLPMTVMASGTADREEIKSDWSSPPYVLLGNANLSLGIFYVLPFGRNY